MRTISTQILLPLLVIAAQVYAQNITGFISGRVVDPSGAAVPNASVVATGAAKKTTVTTVTTAQGDFSLAALSRELMTSPWKLPASRNWKTETSN
jgi:hypothetical protein